MSIDLGNKMLTRPKLRIQNSWIFSRDEDLLVFLCPLLLSWAILAWLYRLGMATTWPPPYIIYVFAVILLDYGHVFSTLFRTYLDKEEFLKRRTLYIVTPLVCFLLAVWFHQLSPMFCLQIYMYFNIYHFVRQQYGWMRLAARKENPQTAADVFWDKVIIYNVTLYPVLWWHVHPTGFTWRDPAPYVSLPLTWVEPWLSALHWALIAAYVLRQGILTWQGKALNVSKHLIWIVTWCIWYPGIVLTQSLLVFALSQTITHGLPYLYLIYRYNSRRWQRAELRSRLFHGRGYFGYLLVILAFGYYAEYWPKIANTLGSDSSLLQSVLTASVLLPSLVHFALDGFIWKLREDKNVNFQLPNQPQPAIVIS